MRAILRFCAVAFPLAALAGCYGAPAVEQPIGVPAPVNGVQGAAGQLVPAGYQCYAGAYTCNLPQYGAIGSGCSCPGIGAPSYGTIR